MFTLNFWKDALVRAVKTFAQSAVAVLAAGATGIFDADWQQLLSVSLLTAFVSILTSISSPYHNPVDRFCFVGAVGALGQSVAVMGRPLCRWRPGSPPP